MTVVSLRRARTWVAIVAAGLLTAGTPALSSGTTRTDLAHTALSAEPAPQSGAVAGYPRQTQLVEPPADPADAAIKLGLTPYHELAPRLNALQAASDRVSVEVIGHTVTGRELYLVTLTAPETPAQAGQQERMRRRILDSPAQAARDQGLAKAYKVPVFIDTNIHGNEWEGTDAALRLVEEYATSTDPQVARTLATTRLSLVMSANPDGRHDNTRVNASGFDLNRDFVTASQPEVVAVRDALIRTQPMLMLDLHGYVNGTLIEPTTPPHGENLEYDLFITAAYPNGLGMERAILDLGYGAADGVNAPQIPFRDWDEGWDDWPPIFTPQYAAYQGAVASHTVEIPLRVNNASYALPDAELQRRSAINTDIAHAAITSSVGYAVEHRRQLIAGQIEIFRRGAAGESSRQVGPELFPEIGPEDVYVADYPRAYVIPVGPQQRSAPAAARLVDHLVANDVQVTRASRPFTIDGVHYPTGSYVVDMHQPKRGMANVLLGAGTDISDRVDAMYDISGWSESLLWGADVTSVPEGTRFRAVGPRISAADPTGSVTGGGDLLLRLDDPADVAALNVLLDSRVPLEWLDDGSVRIPAASRAVAAGAATSQGVVLTPAASAGHGRPLERLVVAAAATPQERWALGEMGFDLRQVDATVLNDGFDWSDVDALYVSAGLRWSDLDPQAQRELRSFLADGGGVVARGSAGAAFNADAGLLEATAVRGRSDANGVVAVDNAGGPITARATPQTFVYSPLWFTGLGTRVTVEQSYAATGPLVSGHWRADAAGNGGQDAARGRPVVVSGVDETGAGVVLFGSEPMFRAHPKGQYPLVARALIWSTLQD